MYTSLIVVLRCRALPDELENIGKARFKAHTNLVIETYTAATQWDVFGIHGDVTVRCDGCSY